MENNRELNEMIFQNYGELYDAMLNYLKENCLVTHFPIQGDRYDEQSNKLLLVGRSLNGWGCEGEYSGAFQYEKAPARRLCGKSIPCIVCKTQIWIYRGKPGQTPL